MKYLNTDKLIQVGDKVILANSPGRIVFVIEDDSYSPSYPKTVWEHLTRGFGVELENGDLFHFHLPDEDLEPI